MKYTVTVVEVRGKRTVERFLRIGAGNQAEAMERVARLHPFANVQRVEGPHD